jgi:hypothetical protein
MTNMVNLQDLIKLAKADGGKFFVMDEAGDAKLVIMGMEDYAKLAGSALQPVVEDVEKVNREITEAQLHEPEIVKPIVETPVIIQEIKSSPHHTMPVVDLREEVIDPTFDFEGPKIDLDEI